jgi:malate dehydrogenase
LEEKSVRKISVIGAGNVGATVVQMIAEKELAHLVVAVDIMDGMAKGKALDLSESAPVVGFNTRIEGTTDFEEISGSGVVVITSGFPRKPGMDRSALLSANGKIIKTVCEQVLEHAPAAVVIMVTNPLDSMTWLAGHILDAKQKRVFGMAGILDCARFKTFIAQELKVAVQDIQAMVLGAHGDSMLPILRYTTIAGIPLELLMTKDRIDAIIERTRHGGGEIVDLLKTGSAFYAPGAAVAEMVEAVSHDNRIIRPCSTYLQGEYGLEDVCIGVPVKLGRAGILKILEIDLNKEELAGLHGTASKVKRDIEELRSTGIID